MKLRVLLLLLAALAPGCGPPTAGLDALQTQDVTLPDGAVVHCDLAVKPIELRRGLMFRASLAPDHGMLFFHDKPGRYQYWMYQVNFPLDLIWMDENRRIVEIVLNAPPCRAKASECPQYGGHEDAQYVLELAGGQAARHHLQVGQTIGF